MPSPSSSLLLPSSHSRSPSGQHPTLRRLDVLLTRTSHNLTSLESRFGKREKKEESLSDLLDRYERSVGVGKFKGSRKEDARYENGRREEYVKRRIREKGYGDVGGDDRDGVWQSVRSVYVGSSSDSSSDDEGAQQQRQQRQQQQKQQQQHRHHQPFPMTPGNYEQVGERYSPANTNTPPQPPPETPGRGRWVWEPYAQNHPQSSPPSSSPLSNIPGAQGIGEDVERRFQQVQEEISDVKGELVEIREERMEAVVKDEDRDRIKDELRDELKTSLRDELKASLRDELKTSLNDDELKTSLNDELKTSLRDELKTSLSDELTNSLMGQLKKLISDSTSPLTNNLDSVSSTISNLRAELDSVSTSFADIKSSFEENMQNRKLFDEEAQEANVFVKTELEEVKKAVVNLREKAIEKKKQEEDGAAPPATSENEFKSLVTSLESLKGTSSELSLQLNLVKEESTKNTEQITLLKSDVIEIESKSAQALKEIVQVTSRIDAVTDFGGDITELKKNVSSLRDDGDAFRSEIDGLQEDAEKTRSNTKKLQSECEKLLSEGSSLRSDCLNVQESLRTDVVSIRGQVDALSSSFDTRHSSVDLEVGEIREDVTALRDKSDDHFEENRRAIAEVMVKINGMSQKSTGIQGEVEDILNQLKQVWEKCEKLEGGEAEISSALSSPAPDEGAIASLREGLERLSSKSSSDVEDLSQKVHELSGSSASLSSKFTKQMEALRSDIAKCDENVSKIAKTSGKQGALIESISKESEGKLEEIVTTTNLQVEMTVKMVEGVEGDLGALRKEVENLKSGAGTSTAASNAHQLTSPLAGFQLNLGGEEEESSDGSYETETDTDTDEETETNTK